MLKSCQARAGEEANLSLHTRAEASLMPQCFPVLLLMFRLQWLIRDNILPQFLLISVLSEIKYWKDSIKIKNSY